jgi:hypothetical protein
VSNGRVIVVYFYCLLVKRKANKRSRSKWCKKWLLRRKAHSHLNLMKDLREDPNEGMVAIDTAL